MTLPNPQFGFGYLVARPAATRPYLAARWKAARDRHASGAVAPSGAAAGEDPTAGPLAAWRAELEVMRIALARVGMKVPGLREALLGVLDGVKAKCTSPLWGDEFDRLTGACCPARFARRFLKIDLDSKQESLLRSAGRRVILNCTRQWGKSTSAAAMAVWRAVHQPGCTIVATGPAKQQAGELVQKMQRYVEELGFGIRRYNNMPASLAFPNGSRILGLSANAANSRGFGDAAMVIVDEAARMTDSMFTAVTPGLAKDCGDLWYMSTPNARSGVFYTTWVKEDPAWLKVMVRADECERFPKEWLEGQRALFGDADFAKEFLCQFGDDERALLRGDWIDRAVKKDFGKVDWWQPAAWRPYVPDLGRGKKPTFVVSVDIGRDGNPTAIVVIELTVRELELDKVTYQKNTRKVFRVRWLEKVKLGTPYMAVVKRLKEIVTAEALKGQVDLVVDGSGVGSPVVELLREAKLGCNVAEIVITSGKSEGGERFERTVPRKNLLYGLERAFYEESLEIAGELAEVGSLLAELGGLQAMGKASGPDDLSMALSMGVWWGRKGLGWK